MKLFLAALLTITMMSASYAQTGTSRRGDVCENRCEAKNWPPRCYEKCRKQWR